MARLIGPDEASREVKKIIAASNLFQAAPGDTATYYADPDPTATPTEAMLTTPADILTVAGATIAASRVTIDVYSMLPLMQFPPGNVDSLLVKTASGPPWRVYARTDDRLDSLTAIATSAVTSAKILDGTIVDGDISSTAGIAASKILGILPVFRPEDAPFNAAGTGIVDDYAAVKACFDAANALKKQVSNQAQPGATVLLRGSYNLFTMNAPIDVMCNVVNEGASFSTPAAYAGTAVRIGHTTSGSFMQNMTVDMPNLSGSPVASIGLLPSGIGYLIRNVYSSDIRVGKVTMYETPLRAGGESWGVAYNEIRFRTLSFGKVDILLKALDSVGWCNHNTFIAGSVTGSSSFAGRRASGARAVLLDGTGSNTITGNTFIGCAFESDTYEYAIEFINAYSNQFYGCRHEQGVSAAAVTVSGDTITSAAHVMSVDQMVIFTGATAPTGMFFDQPYYVVTATTNTFKVSASRGGSAITFTSSGTDVAYSRPPAVRYDTSYDNVIDLPMTPLRWIERNYGSGTTAGLAGNIIRHPQLTALDAYAPPTWPVSRLRNRYDVGSSLNVPVVAVYPNATDPILTPDGWSVGLSERGALWASGVTILEGAGSPEGARIAPPGSLYLRRDPSGTGTSFYLKASGTSNTGWNIGATPPDVQTFTTDGTWTKPAGAAVVQVEMFGGGGGGGSGTRQATSTLATGGAGGGSGGFINHTLKAADIPSTAAVVVGAGGAGGAAITADTTVGAAGSSGTASTFGSLLKAWNGTGGAGGTAAGAASGGAGGTSSSPGSTGAASSATGGVGGSSNVGASAAPGAAGGGITAGNVAANGGVGGTTWASLAGGTGGAGGVVDTTTPVAGGSATAGVPLPGGSSGGGASSITTAAQAGGSGGVYGAGGSGGGASRNGSNSGAGGNGAAGIVRVTTYF
jgi:hypothetical protein